MGGASNTSPTQQSQHQATQRESYGFLFAFMDAWKRQTGIRKLLNIILIFVSVGTYLGILLIEALFHYRKLNNGESQPFNGDPGQRVFIISP